LGILTKLLKILSANVLAAQDAKASITYCHCEFP
jgi:hypothetical protein